MARHQNYETASRIARANAKTFGCDYAVFCDSSGGWNAERWSDEVHGSDSWGAISGVMRATRVTAPAPNSRRTIREKQRQTRKGS